MKSDLQNIAVGTKVIQPEIFAFKLDKFRAGVLRRRLMRLALSSNCNQERARRPSF